MDETKYVVICEGEPCLMEREGVIRALDMAERAIVVIVTDGEENSSHEYTKAKIQELVKARQDSGKWAFIYLGANVDAFDEAGKMGIPMANSGWLYEYGKRNQSDVQRSFS